MSNVQNMHDIAPKAKYDMTTFDEVLVKASSDFMDKAKKDGKPFFVWHNTTRMHVWTFLSPKYQALMNSTSNYGLEEAGMAQLDDSVGALLKHLDDMGEADNTIVIFSTDNGAEVFTWPDGGMTPFKATKGTVSEGGFRVPAIIRWPGHVKPGTVENGIFSGLDWFPTLTNAAGNPDITDQLLKGVDLGGTTYKNHLDGFDQTALLKGTGPSARHEIFYFGGAELGAIRIDDFKYIFYQQPEGWPGPKITTDMPAGDQHPSGSVRTHPDVVGSNRSERCLRLRQRLLRPRVLALRLCPASGLEAGPDGDRLSADAGPGVVQPFGIEGADQ